MKGAAALAVAKKQAAMPPAVLRIVFDYGASRYDSEHFGPAYHPLRPKHLSEGVRQEQHLRLR